MPRRIRLSRARGWRLPEGAVSVARPGKWGNLFVVGQDGTRLQCAALFAVLAGGFIGFGDRVDPEAQLALWRRITRDIGELEGRDLGCWCGLPKGPDDPAPCHGDVLLWLANHDVPRPAWMAGEIDLPRVRLGMDARRFAKLRRKPRAAHPEPVEEVETNHA